MSEAEARKQAIVTAFSKFKGDLRLARQDVLAEAFLEVLDEDGWTLVPSAAARAVDEALSVERVAEVIREAWKAKPPMDSRQLAEYIRAALVAHLRGPRPEGEG